MKKVFEYLAVLAFASVALASCNKEIEITSSSSNSDGRFTVTACLADESDTRLTLVDGGTELFWQVGDQITLFRGSSSSTLTADISEPSKVATFSGDALEGDGDYIGVYGTTELNDAGELWVGCYTVQKAVEGSFPHAEFGTTEVFGHTWITMGKSPSTEMSFYAVFGGFRFTVAQEGIKQVVFESIGGEPISGNGYAKFQEGRPKVVSLTENATNRIVLVAPDGGVFLPGKWYYITALPTELSQGFKLTFFKEGSWARKEFTNPVTIKRGVIGSKQNVDAGLPFNEYEYVDLGLPSGTLWATCNVGSTSPEEYGNIYSWGETEPKHTYWMGNYKHGSYGEYTKYATGVDNKLSYYDYDFVDDAARVYWGSEWRTPSYDEVEELQQKCAWAWTTINGVNGYLVTSKTEGFTDKSIFLPAAGGGYSNQGQGERGGYWTSDTSYSGQYAQQFWFNSDSYSRQGISRYTGSSIRPVYGIHHVESVELKAPSSMILTIGHSFKMAIEISPSIATNKSGRWVSSDESVATVSDTGVATAISEGETNISFIAVDGDISSSSSLVQVLAPAQPEAIDLGLSVMWATFNVGAACPEATGDFFAWGETEPKTLYDWETYKYGHRWKNLTKYNTDSNYGTVDNKTVLDLEDDAASVNWGGEWRMPTSAEMEELIDENNCKWEYAEVNGIGGYKVTSLITGYTDRFIFLPETGYFYSDYWNSGWICSEYLSSTLFNDEPNRAFVLTTNGELSSDDRGYRGHVIRPVIAYFHNPVVGVELDKSNEELSIGQTLQLTSTLIPTYASNRTVSWSSSDPSVASVSSTGLVKARSIGHATITVKTAEGGFTATCIISVVPIKVTGVTLNKTQLSLQVGQDSQLTATVKPDNADNKSVMWESSDTSIATVSEQGLVAAINTGEATITVTTIDGGFTASCNITVPVPVTGVELDKTELTLNEGETANLTASVLPATASDKSVTWTTSNSSVAKVSSDGVVTAVKKGTATIKVTTKDGKFSASCSVTVLKPVTGISLNKTSINLTKGETYTLSTTITPSGASNTAVTWSSSDPSVATVSDAGLVTAVEKGNSTITVTTVDGGFTATCDVTVQSNGSGTLADPFNVAGVKAYIDASGQDDVYVKGKISSIKYAFSSGYGTATFNISDDGTASSEQFTAYAVYFLENKSWTTGNIQIAVGDEVVLCGKVIKYTDGTYETLNKNAYVYSLNGVTANVLQASIEANDITGIAAAGVTGATAIITITNGDGLTPSVTCDGSVVTSASIEGSTITYSVSANSGAARNGSITVTLRGNDGITAASKTIKVLQNAAGVSVSWVKKGINELKDGDVFVLVGVSGGNTYAISNNNGTSSAPSAVAVTVANETISSPAASITWIAGVSNGNIVFYTDSAKSTWLYCTNANNGVRVGTDAANSFKLDSNYLYHTGTSRYVGIYNNSDWRCYTSINNNIKNQSFYCFVKTEK